MKPVLGVKTGDGHDSGAALVYERSGELSCVAISEERLSRVKNDSQFPEQAIDACLAHAGIARQSLAAIVLDKLGPNTPADCLHQTDEFPSKAFSERERTLFAASPNADTAVVNHHLAHAASAFAVTRHSEAAVLIIDGSGTRFPREDGHPGLIAMGASDAADDFQIAHYDRVAETQSIYRATRDSHGRPCYTRLASSQRSGLGHFYTFFSRHILGFRPFQEGKAMGLAAYGDPETLDRFPTFPDELFNTIDTPLLEHCLDIGFRPRKRSPGTDPTTPEYADLALWMQTVLSRGHEHLSRLAINQAGSRTLCAAGGVTLNVVANQETRAALIGDGLLDTMFVQPAANDMGTPLGAALLGYSELVGGALPFQRNLVYLGPCDEASAHSEPALLSRGATSIDDPVKTAVELLLQGKILGWWDGRSEHGPRALGARSILCWPRNGWMKNHLNARVKHREAFRPFAPIVAAEHANEIFDCPTPIPYMLFNATVREGYRERIPAVVHADGSARLQTVSRDDLPKLHTLLLAVRDRDGVGVLLNTSFNVAGEPIVETPEDAVRCFDSTNIDALIIGNTLLQKSP